jgi:hypothetical protein
MYEQVYVNKLEAAKRQTETAIVLYFNNGDPVSVHTLCCAAYDIVRTLNRKHGGPFMLKDCDRFLATKAEKKQFHDCVNQAQNFFKHANGDPDEAHLLDTKWTEALLFDAVQKYSLLAGECPRTMALYFVWFLKKHPEVFDYSALPDSSRRVLERFRRAVPNNRMRFYADYSPIVTAFTV